MLRQTKGCATDVTSPLLNKLHHIKGLNESSCTLKEFLQAKTIYLYLQWQSLKMCGEKKNFSAEEIGLCDKIHAVLCFYRRFCDDYVTKYNLMIFRMLCNGYVKKCMLVFFRRFCDVCSFQGFVTMNLFLQSLWGKRACVFQT